LKRIFLIFAVVMALCSCVQVDDEVNKSGSGVSVKSSQEKWTVVVYMACDNGLEGYGISDLNEIENVNKGNKLNVLVLMDRANGFDATNSNWTDTRLFLAGYDRNSSNTIISQRLNCERLGLSCDSETELDMADRNTLSGVLSFAVENYKADHYALVMWGHGSSEGFANDLYSGTKMTVSQMRKGIQNGMNGTKLDVIAFDTCFGINAENLYELKDCADYVCGTAGLVSDYGWNYEKFLKSFMKTDRMPEDFCQSACDSFKNDYGDYGAASFSAFKLKEFGEAVALFNYACSVEASKIDSYEKRDELTGIIQDKCVTYTGVTFPADCYVDMYSLANNLATGECENGCWEKVKNSLENACLCSWNNLGIEVSVGVFYSTYIGKKITDSSHPLFYVNGSGAYDQSYFVKEMTGWVPEMNDEKSLLDKLFYAVYEQ